MLRVFGPSEKQTNRRNRTGQDRTGQDRTGQDRTGQDKAQNISKMG